MDIENILELAYSTQHFGFHPRSFLDKIYNDLFESLFEALTQLRHHLVEEYSGTVPAKQIEVNTESLFKELVKKLDYAMDRLEVYLNSNIFKVPNHVVLPEDEVHMTHPSTSKQEVKLDKELEILKQSILEERVRQRVLKAKIVEQKIILEQTDLFKNKLQQILTVVTEAKLTKELLPAMKTCMELFQSINKTLNHIKKI